MSKPLDVFEKQVIQIASLGVWQIVTGKPMSRRLSVIESPRWNSKSGLFVTIRKNGNVRGSMGLLETSLSLQEALFDAAQTAATHDQRYPPITEDEISDLEMEVTLLSDAIKMASIDDVVLGETGVIVSRGEHQAVLLPHVALGAGWSAEQFLEAACEKAKLSHKAWKDPNTLVECFRCTTIEGGPLIENIGEFI